MQLDPRRLQGRLRGGRLEARRVPGLGQRQRQLEAVAADRQPALRQPAGEDRALPSRDRDQPANAWPQRIQDGLQLEVEDRLLRLGGDRREGAVEVETD